MFNKKIFSFAIIFCILFMSLPVNAKNNNIAESTRKKLGYYITSKTITKTESKKKISIHGKPNTTYYLLVGTSKSNLKSKRIIKTNAKGTNTVELLFGMTYRGTGTGLQWYIKNKNKLTYDELIYVAEHNFILSNKTEAVKAAKKEAEEEATKAYKKNVATEKRYFAISKSQNGKPIQIKQVNPFSSVSFNLN